MNCLILVAGLPGTGKTSFAEYLCKKLKIPMVSKDQLKETLFDTIGFRNREEKVSIGTAAMEIMYHIAEKHLKINMPIILENNFENMSKPGLLKLVSQYKCKTITVKFRTEKTVLEERFKARDMSPLRHRGHVINTQYPEPAAGVQPDAASAHDSPPKDSAPSCAFDWEQYYSAMMQRGMDTFSVGGEEIIVDTTNFSLVSYDAICGRIREMLA